MQANFSQPNFHNEDVDIGICHSSTEQRAMVEQMLFRDYIYPVASLGLLKKVSLKVPEDLKEQTCHPFL